MLFGRTLWSAFQGMRRIAGLFRDVSPVMTADERAVRPHFDAEFYAAQIPKKVSDIADPVRHYCRVGWRQGLDPSPNFSTVYYLTANPDVATAGINPFVHYIRSGKSEGRPATSSVLLGGAMLVSGQRIHDEIEAVRDRLDTRFYLETYPDVREAGVDPVEHYCLFGWQEGRDPRADFSTSFYLTTHEDVREAGVNPFWHCVCAGKLENRTTISHQANEPRSAQQVRQEVEDLREHFDASFYLFNYGDVAKSGVDPLEHYVNSGWREDRDPSPIFSTKYYRETNPDVANAGLNPFWHYIVSGRKEGRHCQHPSGNKFRQLMTLQPLEHIVQSWKREPPPKEAVRDVDGVLALLAPPVSGGNGQLILSVSHDNYREVCGGVQLCIQREEQLAREAGAIYVNIHPWQPLPCLAKGDDQPDVLVNLLRDGQPFGCCAMSVLIEAMTENAPLYERVDTVIHHLLGHMPEQVTELVLATGRRNCAFWLHDFLTLCPNYALQRNSVSYCGAPEHGSNSCALCDFGAERADHLRRLHDMFKALEIDVLSPSDVTRTFWEEKAGLPVASIRTLPHVKLTSHTRRETAPLADGPIRVAFVGTPAPHKGWNVFCELVYALKDDPGFDFIFFGKSAPPIRAVRHVPVHVTTDDPKEMVDRIAGEAVDFVVHWPSWPETFSFSTFEALAASAYVITNAGSGNVASIVRKKRRGAVLEDQDDLHAFFTDGRAAGMLAKLREVRSTKSTSYAMSRMVYDAIELQGARK